MESKVIYGNHCLVIETDNNLITNVSINRISTTHGDLLMESLLEDEYLLSVCPGHTITNEARKSIDKLKYSQRVKEKQNE